MRTPQLVVLTTVSLLTALTLSGGSRTRTHPSVSIAASAIDQVPVRASARETYGKLPMSFEANLGQTDPAVDFLARGSGYTLFLTASEAVLSLRGAAHRAVDNARGEQQDMSPRTRSVLRMQLIGSRAALGVGSDELAGKVNYFIGSDP